MRHLPICVISSILSRRSIIIKPQLFKPGARRPEAARAWFLEIVAFVRDVGVCVRPRGYKLHSRDI